MVIPTTTSARILAEQGFRILPVRGKDKPLQEHFGAEFPDATWAPEWFASPGCLAAILCGPCPPLTPDWLLCLDWDGNWASVPALVEFRSKLPQTASSHGGRHLFFRVPPSLARDQLKQWSDLLRTKNTHGAAIDVKLCGGYAAERWDWDAGTDPTALVPAIATLDASVVLDARASCAPGRSVVDAEGDAGEAQDALLDPANGWDLSVVVSDAEHWLRERAPRPVEGTGGVTLMIVFGAMLVGFGLPEDTALELVECVWNELCETPWTPDEIATQWQHKVDEINRLGSARFVPLQLAWMYRNSRANTLREIAEDAAVPAALVTASTPLPAIDVEEALITWNGLLKRTAKGEVASNIHNVLWTLTQNPNWRGVFGYDEFTHEEVYLRRPEIPECPRDVTPGGSLSDTHITAFRSWFARVVAPIGHEDVLRAIQAVARENPHHAVRAYLAEIRGTWDGTDRNLCEYFGAEPTLYHRAICAKWLRSAVARALKSPRKVDTMLILEGPQGERKSSALAALCPDVRWYNEVASKAVGSKDFMQDMNGIWLAEFQEVDQLIHGREESELKALLSRQADRYRPSYGRKSETYPRQLVFAGSTNKSNYLKDETGNRRYWVLLCGTHGPVRDGKICDDRDQLWAQTLQEVESGGVGGQWWLTPAEDLSAHDEQEARLEEDPWDESVESWLKGLKAGATFTIHDALDCLPGVKTVAEREQRDLMRMGKVLRKFGCSKKRKQSEGERIVCWTK